MGTNILLCVALLTLTAAAMHLTDMSRNSVLLRHHYGQHEELPVIWELANSNRSVVVQGCQLPGNVATHLYQHGVLPQDPLYRFNDVHYRWVAYETWVYQSSGFLVSTPKPERAVAVTLAVERARVYCNISLSVGSGPWVLVGETASQHVVYEWDVSGIILPLLNRLDNGNATLRIQLVFAPTASLAATAVSDYSLLPFPVAPPYPDGIPGRNFVRVEQSSFGWDWGPAFAAVGLDAPMTLTIHRDKSANVSHSVGCLVQSSALGKDNRTNHSYGVSLDVMAVYPQTQPLPLGKGGSSIWELNLTMDISLRIRRTTNFTVPSSPSLANVTVQSATISWLNDTLHLTRVVEWVAVPQGVAAVHMEGTMSLVLWMDQPALWWPAGFGAHTRHQVRGSVALWWQDDSLCEGGTWLCTEWALSSPLAIRSAALITESPPPIPQAPRPHWQLRFAPPNIQHPPTVSNHSMYFEINGKAVFAMGVNVIPPSALPTPTDHIRLRRDLDSAVAANVNMVRVWGGGYYLADWFYEYCDEHGIMVWQEFMFACAEYPVDAKFLELVALEVKQQVKRLMRFGSVVLWSANNENEAYDRGPGAAPYETLYVDTVLATLVSLDQSRPMWPSSPSRGFVSGVVVGSGWPNGATVVVRKEGTASLKPSDNGHRTAPRGDAHYYNYTSCPDAAAYPLTHFASEYGFQSLPWPENLALISDPSAGDWNLNSSFMHHRQHHLNGNLEIAQLLVKNFFHANWTVYDIFTSLSFQHTVFLSQLQQAICIEDQASYYRRGRDDPAMWTMGSLYWQLNQNWQAPSWSSLEFGGEWKILHYAMRRAYSPVHLSVFVESGVVYAHVANDLDGEPLKNVSVQVSLVRFEDGASVPLLGSANNDSTPRCQFLSSTCFAQLPSGQGTYVWSAPLDQVLAHSSATVNLCQRGVETCFLWIQLKSSLSVQGRPLLFVPVGRTPLTAAASNTSAIEVTVLSIVLNTAVVRVRLASSSCGVALYVFLRSARFPLGVFDTNLPVHLITPCAADSATNWCPATSVVTTTFTNPLSSGSLGSLKDFESSIVVDALT